MKPITFLLLLTTSFFSLSATAESMDDETFHVLANAYLDSVAQNPSNGGMIPVGPSVSRNAKPNYHPLEIAPKTPVEAPSPPQILTSPQDAPKHPGTETCKPLPENGYTVNFENIQVIELIRFISQISNKNFVFNNCDLQFRITIVSQDATSVDDLMSALLQVLQIHGLSVIEEGNNVLIHNIADARSVVSSMSSIITDENALAACGKAVVTRVFRINNVTPEKLQQVIAPLVSKDAIVQVLAETRHLIISDINSNVEKVADLINILDTPAASLDIAEYTVKSNAQALVAYAKEILAPLTVGNPLQLMPQLSSNKIFIVSTPFLINKALQVLESLDVVDIVDVIDLPASAMVNNNFYVYKLKYQNGEEIVAAIRSIGNSLQFMGVSNMDLINTIASMEWVGVNNSIVITGTKESIEKVLELIGELDTAPNQVYIEALIIDTTIQNAMSFGVQWVALGNEQQKLAFASGLLTSTGGGSLLSGAQDAMASPPPNAGRGDVPLAAGFGFGIVGNIVNHNGTNFLTLGALLQALDSEEDTTVVLNPRIMTEDTQQANFFVGQNIPYQTTSTVIRDTGSVTQNIQYEDIGIQVQVTPQIGPNGIVTLDISEAISEVQTANATIVQGTTQQFLLAPTTSKILASTRVHVPDGAFLVMSGHIRDEKSFTRSGIPCLGTLPLIGPLFSSTSEARIKRNLIMFIRPRILYNAPQGIALTNQEGYDYNWESHPCSIIECGPEKAPECQTYPPIPSY